MKSLTNTLRLLQKERGRPARAFKIRLHADEPSAFQSLAAFFRGSALVIAVSILGATVLHAADGSTNAIPLSITNPADAYSGISGPGEPVTGAGLGGWRSGKDDVRYKGPHPKNIWQLDWDAKETSTDKVI